MKRIILFSVCLFLTVMSCSEDNHVQPEPVEKIEIIFNDIPFPTEKYYRIPYTLKMWEYEKEGLKLERIQILDDESKAELMILEKADFPYIYKAPIPSNPYFTSDPITSYYVSIQLPILLDAPKPSKISHRFTFKDTVSNSDVIIEGAVFAPRLAETPIAVASPVKGKNWIFANQSTMAYHFYVFFFLDGQIYSSERFAFDNIKLDDNFIDIFNGDHTVNNSYYNYGDTLYAVANGTVVMIKDGRPENDGDLSNVVFNNLDELGGNYLALDIGGGKYAFYAHCIPGSFMVEAGDEVLEGEPIALLGNSGNSSAPHLHFHICDGTSILFSKGVPFVLKSYTKIGELGKGASAPVQIFNSMMEENTVISFE